MTRVWAQTGIAAAEIKRYQWHEAFQLLPAVLPIWSMLVTSGVLCGLGLRLRISSVPEVYVILDLAAAILWLCGWPLATAIATVHARSLQHLGSLETWHKWPTRFSWLLATVVCLALAPAGILLTYDPAFVFQEISTQDAFQLNIRQGPLLLCGLALGGACIVLLSTIVAIAAKRLARSLGQLLWGLCGILFNLTALCNLGEYLSRTRFDNQGPMPFLIPSLGQVVRQLTERLSDPRLRYEYTQGLVATTFGPALVLLAILVALNLFIVYAANVKRQWCNYSPLVTACVLAMILAAAYSVGQHAVYVVDPEISSPGDWRAVFGAGSVTLILTYWLFRKGEDAHLFPQLLSSFFLILTVLCFVLSSGPAISTGDGEQLAIANYALVTFAFLTTAIAVVDILIASWPGSFFTGAGVALMAACCVPTFAAESPLSVWATGISEAGVLVTTLAVVSALIYLRWIKAVAWRTTKATQNP